MNIGGFMKNSFIDFPSHLAAVVFTNGCNFDCWYCHNQDLLHETKENYAEEEILSYIEGKRKWLEGIVITGGEPTLQPDLKDFIKKIKKMGLDVKLDTNGLKPEVIKELLDEKLLDYIAMDVKTSLAKYKDVVKRDIDTTKIQESIKLIMQSGVDYEFRTTFAPKITIEDIEEIARMIKGAKAYFLQKYEYHPGQTEYLPHNKTSYLKAIDKAKAYIDNVNLRGF